MSDEGGSAGGAAPRPEDRPVDPEAVARLERLPEAGSDPSRVGPGRPLVRARAPRSSTVTTAGAILVALGAFVAVVSIAAIAPSGGMELLGLELSGPAAAGVFVGLAVVYAAVGVLVLLRRPIARPLGFAVGTLALLFGFAQLRSAGFNGVPTVVVAAFILYALGIGGAEFRRR